MQALLKPGVRLREVLGWAFYDFANSGYTTVVITAVYSTYFVSTIAAGTHWATLAWTLALSASYAWVMFTMPILGAWADRHASKKRLLMLATWACVLSTIALTGAGPGEWWLAWILVFLSNVFYSYGESLSGAFLPELAQPEAMGRVSGWAWAWGYLGGMLTLGLCLAYVLWAQSLGQTASQFVPVTLWITAAMYIGASGFTFVWLHERGQPPTVHRHAVASPARKHWQQWLQTWRESKAIPDFRWLMASAVAYQAGVAVAIALAAIYAEQVMGFQTQQTMLLIFVLNVAALLGALIFGYVQDAWGHRRTLSMTLWGWIITCIWAAASQTQAHFWGAAAIAGLCLGSSQSAGRAMAGMMIPAKKLAEYFGLWTVAIRLASILGPLSYGLITWLSGGNHRLAIVCVTGFFVMGLLLLRRVNVHQGQIDASRLGH
ncbi:MAG: hypothetical protein RLZZ397_209 [Pseudomonadota bacterium]